MMRKISNKFFCSIVVMLTALNCVWGGQSYQLHFNGKRTDVWSGSEKIGFKKFLLEQLRIHPSMQVEDVLKQCYQGAYGAEHILKDPEKAGKYFYKEFDAVEADFNEPLFELISPDFIRVNLRAWKAAGFPAKWLFNMFASAVKMDDGDEIFQKYLAVSRELLDKKNLGKFIRISQKITSAPHHSEIFRRQEKPSYRVVSIRYINIFPVLKMAAALPDKNAKVIVIDGRSASGKTTLSRQLETVLETDAVHMDDFFLPPQMRTKERYNEPGGNVHYERFIAEVLPQLNSAGKFQYRKFSCSAMKLGDVHNIRQSPWRIVEGAYSMHPKFGNYADLKIFYDIHPDEQMRRIISRNGIERAEMFKKLWIPFEEAYIKNCHPDKRADIIIGR